MIFVTGGARSGKSAFALRTASSLAGDAVSFIATAEALDTEMSERIEQHKLERNLSWQTLEETLDLESVLERSTHELVVLDCVALWVSNMLLAGVGEAACADPLYMLWGGDDHRAHEDSIIVSRTEPTDHTKHSLTT